MHDNELRGWLFQNGIEIPLGGEVFYVAAATTQAWTWLQGKVNSANIFQTVNEALSSCVGSRLDTIVMMPYHTETVAAADGIDLDTAGCRLIGIGTGDARPLLDYTNAAGELVIGAADVVVKNVRFKANVPEVLIGIEIEAAGDNFIIDSCFFSVETTGTDEFMATIQVEAGANYGTIKNCYIDNGLGNATFAIHLNGASTNHVICNNFITGDYSTANIAGSTAASTVLFIHHNTLQNGTGTNIGAQPCIELNGNSTGIISDNDIACNLATMVASLVSAATFSFRNYYNEDISGDATGALFGTASAND